MKNQKPSKKTPTTKNASASHAKRNLKYLPVRLDDDQRAWLRDMGDATGTDASKILRGALDFVRSMPPTQVPFLRNRLGH